MQSSSGLPTALSISSYLPFPVTSGGRKRHLRLLEAIERAGAIPHLLTEDASAAGQEEAESRGWSVEVCLRPRAGVALRSVQHLQRDVMPHNPQLSARAKQLAIRAAFVQLEEIGAAQYARAVAGVAPLAVSLHNVDSEVLAGTVAGNGLASRIRHRYHLSRMTATEVAAARRSDLMVCVSEHDRAYFDRIGSRRSVLAPNGVDDELFDVPLPLPSEPAVFFFGQFGWRPNADGALRYINEIWPRVTAVLPEARLRIAGPGSKEVLASVASSHPGVEVLGFVSDLSDELAASRMVVAPLWLGGGTRIKVLEALAAARPVVGTTVGVERLGFVSGRHGLVADSPQDLATATLAVLTQDEAANRYAREARELGREYRWLTTTAAVEVIYGEWVAAQAQTQP